MMIRKGILAIVFCLGFTALTSAQENQEKRGKGSKGAPTYAQLIEEMDANEDGKLAESELKGPLKDDFAKIDTDEDGFISEEEFKNAPKPKRKGQGNGQKNRN